MNMLLENVREAWEGLLANKLRSSLTMLGVIIGVAAVVALLSIGEGATAAITDRISSAGTNLLFVQPGFVARGPVRGAFGGATTLTYDDARALAESGDVPDVTHVAPEYSRFAQVIAGDTNINASVTGVTPEYVTVLGLDIARGRFVDEADLDRRADVAVLGAAAAEELFGGTDPVGQKIKVNISSETGSRRSLTVVGVLGEQGDSMAARPDDTIYVPITTAQTKLFEGRNQLGERIVSRINVMAVSEERADAATGQIEGLLLARHELPSMEEADFDVMSQADLLEMASEVSGIMKLFLGAIAGISLLVGGIGIMNIMLVTVTERTREIGLRKSLGARRLDILTQFLLESIVLSALGGMVGVATGIGIARLVDLSGLMRAVTPPEAVILAFGAALVVGLAFGLYPANRAAGFSPIEALRYE